MTADPRRIKELFVAALDLSDAQARQAFLERECGADAELRQRLESPLMAHENPTSVLDRPLAAVESPIAGPATADYHGPAEDVGTIIAGRYKLLEQIGEGGMGTVWVAEQTQPVRRKVALKLIKAGIDSKTVLSRFEAERQALALMDHPNIAKVLDAGATDSGRPFFVMELVKGVPFTRYCDDARLRIAETFQRRFYYDRDAIRHHLKRALELRSVHLGSNDPKTHHTMRSLGMAYRFDDNQKALQVLGDLVARASATFGPVDGMTLHYRELLADAYEIAGKQDRLIKELQRLVQLYEGTNEKDKADTWREKLQEAKNAVKK